VKPALRVIEGGAAAPPSRARALEVMAAGAGLTLVFTLAAALPSWAGDLGRLQGLMAIAFAFFALALWRLPRWRHLPHAGLAVFVVALAMRFAVLKVTPTLSEDLWRCLWDGRLLAHGLDPYARAPADPALTALRDTLVYPHLPPSGLRTLQLPLAELGFGAVALVAPGMTGMKCWIVLHDLALVAVLLRWCTRRGGSALPAIAYAWNPLVVLEYAGSGHTEPTGLLWLVIALAWLESRPLLSATAFAAAVLVKLAPLVALPFLLARWPWRARGLALVLTGAGLAGFLALARGPGSGLEAYAGGWRDNALCFHYLAALLGEARARGVAAGLLVLLVGLLLWRRADAVAAARTALRSLLLLAPALQPWHLGWALALEPIAPSWPWLVLSAFSLLEYGLLASPGGAGAFQLPLAWRWFEYGVPLALAAALTTARFLRTRGPR
jgi:alpha-1,6-mannosyltransferase